jgi:hypothetical protein
MEHKNEILKELEAIAPSLIAMQQLQAYKVAPNYFEAFPQNMMDKIYATEYSVPNNYFDTLPNIILQKIKQENELTEIAPLLAAMPKTNVYKTPEGYFEQFAVKPKKEGIKIVALFKYAVAAVIIGLLGFFVANRIDNYKQQEQNLAALKQAEQILKTSSVDAELGKLSSAEVEQYLLQVGTDVEGGLAAANAFNEQEEEVNNADELFDDATLNDLLETNTTQN